MQKFVFDIQKFKETYRPWLWVGLSPSLLLDLFLIYRLIAGIPYLKGSSVPTTPLRLLDFVIFLVLNAVFFKTLPLIVYIVHRSHLRQSQVILTQDKVYFLKRVLVLYEFDFGYTHFQKYHITNITSVSQTKTGNLVIGGDVEVHCLDEGKEAVVDLRKGDLHPRILKRKKCIIPGVFEKMEQMTAQVKKMAAQS